ncbi:hypothetical protein ACE7GA_15280 [Roseomonas sp. CCTCC AB2023176]|uniref:hypothetical protein n=1 Tax=Roseomonas sp. CCTCC AB2023176 TaxID=3342640 RepID=UPI0035DED8A7
MAGGRAASFLCGVLVGLGLAASVALAQAVSVLRDAPYGIAPGQTASLFCSLWDGSPRRNSEPLVQRNTITVANGPMRVAMVTCFD